MLIKKVISVFTSLILLLFFVSCSFLDNKNVENSTEESQAILSSKNTYVVNYIEETTTTKKILSSERSKCETAIEEVFIPIGQPEDYYKNNQVLRWKSNIKIKLIGDYSKKDKETVQYLINRVNYNETIPLISFAKKGEAANFVMAFGSEYYLNSHYADINYTYQHRCIVASNNEKTIEHVTTFVETQSSNMKQNKYTTRVFLEGLGIGKYESKTYNVETVFNPNSETYYLSEFDNLLISLYYGSNIKNGENMNDAIKLFKRNLNSSYDFTTTTTTTMTTSSTSLTSNDAFITIN